MTLLEQVRIAWHSPGIYAKASIDWEGEKECLAWAIERPARYGYSAAFLRVDGTWSDDRKSLELPIWEHEETAALALALQLAKAIK